jgi:hypothetical protein
MPDPQRQYSEEIRLSKLALLRVIEICKEEKSSCRLSDERMMDIVQHDS